VIFTENSFDCDTLIIGAGAVGLLTAYYLAEKENVTVVDKSFAGNGRTKGQADIIPNDGGIYSSLIYEKENNSNDFTDKLKEICQQIHDNSFVKKPLCIYSDKSESGALLRRLYAKYSYADYDAMLLSERECADILPFYAEGAVTVNGGSFVINTSSFARRLASYLSLHGVTVAEMMAVTGIKPEKNLYHIKTDNGTDIFASKIIDTRPNYPLINVFTAKTEPNDGLIYATKNINIKNQAIYSDGDCRITVYMRNPILSPFIDGAFSYCEETLKNELFFDAKIGEFIIGKYEPIFSHAQIKRVNDTYFRLVSPYENGLLSAIMLAEQSAENCGKQNKRKLFSV